jgi:hypothetical protein
VRRDWPDDSEEQSERTIIQPAAWRFATHTSNPAANRVPRPRWHGFGHARSLLALTSDTADWYAPCNKVRDVTPRQSELLDARTLLAACGSDAAILSKICQAVLEQLPRDLTALEHAFRIRDALLLRDSAHRLYGMVAAFSSLAGTMASDLEERADRGELGEAGQLLSELEAIAPELLRQAGGVTLDSLLAASAGVRSSTAPP